MARKKSNDNAGALGVLLFAALATLIRSPRSSMARLFWWLGDPTAENPAAFPMRYQTGFSLQPVRIAAIAELDKTLADERKVLASLESQGCGLSRRGDGEFDERSGLGKRLNHELSTSRASGLVIDMAELRNHSYQRRSQYLGIKVGAASWGKAGIAYITAILFFAIYTPE